MGKKDKEERTLLRVKTGVDGRVENGDKRMCREGIMGYSSPVVLSELLVAVLLQLVVL